MGNVIGRDRVCLMIVIFQQWILQTGYPNVPLKSANESDISKFFNELHESYKWAQLYDANRPALPLLLPPEKLAKIITGTSNTKPIHLRYQVITTELNYMHRNTHYIMFLD